MCEILSANIAFGSANIAFGSANIQRNYMVQQLIA